MPPLYSARFLPTSALALESNSHPRTFVRCQVVHYCCFHLHHTRFSCSTTSTYIDELPGLFTLILRRPTPDVPRASSVKREVSPNTASTYRQQHQAIILRHLRHRQHLEIIPTPPSWTRRPSQNTALISRATVTRVAAEKDTMAAFRYIVPALALAASAVGECQRTTLYTPMHAQWLMEMGSTMRRIWLHHHHSERRRRDCPRELFDSPRLHRH